MDDADDNRDADAPTLMDICAVNGNAEAVALLIQHGADLAKGVLHEIVIESVCHLCTRYVTYCTGTATGIPVDAGGTHKSVRGKNGWSHSL